MTAACDERFWKLFVPSELFSNTKLSGDIWLADPLGSPDQISAHYIHFQMMVAEQ